MKIKSTRFNWSISLTAILAIAFFSLSVVVLLISGILQIVSYNQTQQEGIISKLQIIAQDVTGKVTNFIHEKISVLNTTSMVSGINVDSPEKQEQIISSLLGLQSDFRQIALVDDKGEILSGASRFSTTVFKQFARKIKSELIAEINKQDIYISRIFFDEASLEPLLIIGVTDKNALTETQEILVCEINFKFMKDFMEKLKIGKTGLAYVVDRQGTLIAFRDNSLVLKGKNLADLTIVKEFISNAENVSTKKVNTYSGITGVRVIGTYAPLITPDWAVITELPWTEAYEEVAANTIITTIINLIMVVLAGVIGVILARKLAVPLINLTKTANAIVYEEKGVQAEESGTREIISLAKAFNSMTTQLQNKAESFRQANEVLKEVLNTAKEIIHNLNSTSKEIEAGAQEQTSGANEFASGITEVSATLEELTITAKQITKNVGELVFSSEEVITLLKDSEKQLLNTVVQLEDVGRISAKNASKIGELGNRSTVINEMVEVIKEIANKTNILSINASIEASQSGEAGTRFFVVAAEIRELSKETIVSAQKAEKAAREIQDLFNAIIVSSESESVKVIGSGQIVKSIYTNIESIMAKINNNYTFTQKIDVSIKQQESGSRQAADTMRQMAEIARQFAETARQTATTVQDIVKISLELDAVVKKSKSNNQ